MSDTSSAPQTPTVEDLPASPCISVCKVDRNTKMCIGCHRTLDEIGQWRTMTIDQKRDVVAACKQRAADASN